MASIADDEKAPLAFTASATVTSSADIPLRSDGSLDATQINVSDRDQRAAFVAQLPDLCRSYGSNDTVDILLPAMIEACQFDDAALAIATSLAEVGNSIRPERSPLKEMEELLRELFDNVDGHIGSAAAKAAVDFVSSADTTDEERLMFVGMVSKLAAGGQGISAKCAAAAMLPAAHSAALHLANTATIKSPPNPGKASTVIVVTDANGSNDYESKRRVVRTKALFSDLIRDASSAVRRAAAASLAEWLNQISTATATPDVLPQVKAWATDLIRDRLQDSVRFAALPHLVAIARLSPTQEWNSIVQLAVAAAKDPAWRVRWTAARHLVSLMLVMPSLATALLPSLQALAKDEEAEVRSCVAQRLGEAASTLSQQIVSAELVPLAIAFSTDEHPTVKAAAAGSVCDVCRCCTDADVGKLVDIITHFIEDPSDTVQLNVLRSLPNMKDRLADRVVMQRITSLLSTVSQVSVSRWRVRERVGEQLRHLAHYVTLDDAATFESMLHQLVDDPVAAVRLTAIGSLPLVAAHFGPAWTRAHLERFGDRLTSGYRERQMYVAVLDAMLPFASYMPRSSSMLRTSSSADHQSPTVAANSSAAPGAASNPTTSGSPQRSLTVSASDGLSGSPAPGSRSPLAPMASFASAGSSDPTEVAFWNHVRSDLNTLAKDSVANVRLAVCRWAFAPSSARTLQLADLRAALQLSFGTDTCEEVRAAAMNAVAGKSLTMDPF